MAASHLAKLRALAPMRPLTPSEARYIAERQATRLLALCGITSPPVPTSLIESLPHIRVERVDSRHSGMSTWHRGYWYLLVSSRESLRRAAFSAAHEYKHVIDHGVAQVLYRRTKLQTQKQRAETACNQFAAAVRMPKVWVRRAWTDGIQDLSDLASLFQVSREAMRIRLEVLGLIERRESERSAA
ncbi:MAG: ImmA/IrrE family metallo-endopeptidase [Actinomycetota bacterium]